MKKSLTKNIAFKTIFTIVFLLLTILNFSCKGKNSVRQLNIAIQPSGAFLPMYIVKENEWLEEELSKDQITVNWYEFESGPPINESLASKVTDIGFLGDVPTVSAIAAGNKNLIFGIATKAPEHYAALVSANSEIQSPKDFKNKKIATVVGSAGHNLLKKLLNENNLTFNDIELLNVSPGDTQTVLSTGLVDAVVTWEPNIIRATDSGVAKIAATGADTDLIGVNTIVVRKDYAAENADILKKVLIQYERAARLLPDLDDESLAKLGKPLNLSAAQIKKILPKYDYSTKIDEDSVAALQDTIDFLKYIDILKETYDIKDYLVKD